MLSDLKAARAEEARSIMALLTSGQDLRRLLAELLALPCVAADLPGAMRLRASQALRQHQAAARRYAQASAARSLARQRPVTPGTPPPRPKNSPSGGRRTRHARVEPQAE